MWAKHIPWRFRCVSSCFYITIDRAYNTYISLVCTTLHQTPFAHRNMCPLTLQIRDKYIYIFMCPLLLSNFQQRWYACAKFSKSFKYQILWKSAKLFSIYHMRMERSLDSHDKCNTRCGGGTSVVGFEAYTIFGVIFKKKNRQLRKRN